jgi:transcriptional regulator with AAA-type ATPase domain
MTAKSLTTREEWNFLEAVAGAAFANPFSAERDALDVRIGAVEEGGEAATDAAIARVEAVFARMERRGRAHLGRCPAERRDTLRSALLFHLFHRHAARFDRLIAEQAGTGDAPAPVPFARELLGELRSHGFGEEEGARIVALFHQIRRGYDFIRNGLVGSSPSVRDLRRRLWDCVFTHDMRAFEDRYWNRLEDFPILLLGETGTGKGAAAAAVGRSGFIPFDPARGRFEGSFTRNFVSIHLSQFSEGLLESELFGHRKGAFTGAVDHHEGLFSRCPPHGATFLDEIGDASPAVQIKLLQVLQERTFFPVGSHEPKRFHGRVLAATNRPLDELRRTGAFRDDLYYRLCSNVVVLPTLRDRLREEPGELSTLVGSILERLAGEGSEGELRKVLHVLERDIGPGYGWPGNVRELEQAVKRIVLTGECRRTPSPPRADDAARLARRIRNGSIDAATLLSEYCALLHDRFGSWEETARASGLDRRTVRKHALRRPPAQGAAGASPAEPEFEY